MATKKTSTAKKTAGATSIKGKMHHGKKAKPTKELLQLQSAIKVLAEGSAGRRTAGHDEAMEAKKLWTSPGGKMPR